MMKRHPKALPYLFLTEMWERFGFYVVQGLLVLFMTKAFGFSDSRSFTVLGTFTALAYISPIAGGYLADKILGFKQAILWGGIFLIIGYGLLALPGDRDFYLALATIIIGTGLFKPNISSLLGALYPQNDSGRDSGFTIFYIGINLGVLLSGICSGFIKNNFGWHAGFALASLGLIVGLIIFGIGLKRVEMPMNTHLSVSLQNKWYLRRSLLIIYCILAIGLISFLLQSTLLGDWLLSTVGVLMLVFIFVLAFRQQGEDRKRLLALNTLIISSIVFWMIYWQMFFSVNLFIDRVINKTFLSMQVPTTAFYAMQSLFIIFLGPLFAWGWQRLNENNRNPSSFIKFTYSIAFLGLAFLVLAISTYFYNDNNLVSPFWIVLSYLFITIGELLLSPIGLSAVTMLSPPHLTGMMMGIWFVAMGFGGHFAGALAKISSVSESMQDTWTQLPIYRSAFLIYALLAFAVAVLMYGTQMMLAKIVKKE